MYQHEIERKIYPGGKVVRIYPDKTVEAIAGPVTETIKVTVEKPVLPTTDQNEIREKLKSLLPAGDPILLAEEMDVMGQQISEPTEIDTSLGEKRKMVHVRNGMAKAETGIVVQPNQ